MGGTTKGKATATARVTCSRAKAMSEQVPDSEGSGMDVDDEKTVRERLSKAARPTTRTTRSQAKGKGKLVNRSGSDEESDTAMRDDEHDDADVSGVDDESSSAGDEPFGTQNEDDDADISDEHVYRDQNEQEAEGSDEVLDMSTSTKASKKWPANYSRLLARDMKGCEIIRV